MLIALSLSAPASVYRLVRVRTGVAEVGHKCGNFGLCWCGWKTVECVPIEEFGSRCRERARRVYYGVTFGAERRFWPPLDVASEKTVRRRVARPERKT